MGFQNQSVERGSDAWNVAKGYTDSKILNPLIEMDKLIKIAIYGAEHIEDSIMLMNQPDMKTQFRIEALDRLIDALKITIENAEFQMSEKKLGDLSTKEKLKELENRIKEVEQFMGALTTNETDMRTSVSRTIINEQHFSECLKVLREIKTEIPKPLNKEGLIFAQSEEIDLDSLKREIVEGG